LATNCGVGDVAAAGVEQGAAVGKIRTYLQTLDALFDFDVAFASLNKKAD
jgi:hypothetical protein